MVVGFGAFGAHALESMLDDYSLDIWQTAVQYQMFHTVALLAVHWLVTEKFDTRLNKAGYAFIVGIILFSGSLYLLALTGMPWLGMVTPVGGLAFLAGWLMLAMHGMKRA